MSDLGDLDVRLVPFDDDPLTPDEELTLVEEEVSRTPAFDLDPALETTADVASAEVPPVGRSWEFDYEKHAFVGEGYGGAPQPTHGLASLRAWVQKVLRVERGAHAIYSDDFGIDRPYDLLGQPHQTLDIFERIRDALLVHPRITDVTDFTGNAEADSDVLEVGFTVALDDETLVPFESVRLVS